MRIISSVFIITLCWILSSCSAGITRYGYNLQDIQQIQDSTNCHLAIKNNAKFPADEVEVLGQVKVYDTQFSVKCDEEYVLDILSREACALGANLINITEEKQPNFWSTCYRVKAQYLKLNDKQKALAVKSDPQYDWELIKQRGAEGRARTKAVVEGSIVGGAIGGVIGGAAAGK